MKKLLFIMAVVLSFVLVLTAASVQADSHDQSCWGQATKAAIQAEFPMGKHSSQQPTPRLGLRNLARALADAGVIPDDSMQSLGAFVAAELELEISACQ